jgi:hypothetical protein
MEFAVVVVLVVIVVVVVMAVMRSRRSSSDTGTTERAEPGKPVPDDFDRLRPPYREFHVDGTVALVTFEVPLGPDGADEVLSSLLVREAVEVVRERQRDGSALPGIEEVKAFGRRDGSDVYVGEVEIAVSDELPVIGFPMVELHDVDLEAAPTAAAGRSDYAARAEGDRLDPIGEEIQLTAAVEAGLRAQGVDPDTMSAGDLIVGLLRLSNHQVTPGPTENTYLARRPGVSLYVKVVDHVPGSYPELDEADMRAFVSGFTHSKAERGWLVTDKFGPFAVYEKERRMPKCRYVTRERLQGVVDGFALS